MVVTTQARADAPDGIELDERADTGDEHGGLNEQRRVDGGECLSVIDGDARNQHDGRDVCHEHGQHVLQAEGNGFADRDSAFCAADCVFARDMLR